MFVVITCIAYATDKIRFVKKKKNKTKKLENSFTIDIRMIYSYDEHGLSTRRQ